MVQGGARREGGRSALHRVFVVAVADVEVVVDGVVRDREVVCGIVNAVIAEMIDHVVGEQRVVGGEDRAGPHVLDV